MRVMMSLAGSTAELGVFRSFIQMAPTEMCTYSLPYHTTLPPTPKHTGLRMSLRWQTQAPRPKWPFCFNVDRRSSQSRSGGSTLQGPSPLPQGWGLLGYTTGGRGVTQLSWPRRSTAHPLRLEVHSGDPIRGRSRDRTPLARLPARRAPGRPCPQPPVRAGLPREARHRGPRGRPGAARGAGAPSRLASPARAHTYCCRGCRSRRGAAGPGG